MSPAELCGKEKPPDSCDGDAGRAALTAQLWARRPDDSGSRSPTLLRLPPYPSPRKAPRCSRQRVTFTDMDNGARLGAEDVQFLIVRRCRRAVAGLVLFLVRHRPSWRVGLPFPSGWSANLLGFLGEPVVIGSDIQHRLLGGWITRTHRDGSGVRRHFHPSLHKSRLAHLP